MRRRCVLLLTFVSLAAFAAIAWGQGSFGSLTGNITDPTGATLPGASVKAINLESAVSYSATSTTEGIYLLRGLPPGSYRVTVSKSGFKTVTQEPVAVSTATVATLNFSLALGQVTESVQVTAELVQLQTATAEIGTVLPEKDMLDLPISLGGAATAGASGRRQIENFIFLTPGVTGSQWSKSINGAPGFSQEILIDGVDAQNLGAPSFIADSTPPYEAVSEFKVQNTLFPAEYGLGYGVMNFTLKSGGNSFHGDVFEFLRNDVLNARGFFGTDKPTLRQNEFGGTIGGPVILPHYNGKEKTHFFFAYSGFTLRGGLPQPGLVTIPTIKERTGDFSDYPAQIYDPATTCGIVNYVTGLNNSPCQLDAGGNAIVTRQPFDGNVIPADRISGVAQRAVALLPPPDFPNKVFENYVDRSSQPGTEHAWSIKIDHVINEKQRLSGAFWWVNYNTVINGPVAGELNPGLRHTPTHGGGFRVNHFFNITPSLLNHLAYGYTPTQPTWTLWEVDKRKGNQILKIPGIPADAGGYPDLNFDRDYQSLGNGNENGYDPQKYHNWVLSDDVSWVRGRHELKFGAMYRFRNNVAQDNSAVAGYFDFSALSTSQPSSPDFSILGNSFASFMLGHAFDGTRKIPAPVQDFRDGFWAFYVDDAIKLSRKVTLGLGLRYELPIYVTEKNGIMSFMDPNRPNPGAGGYPGALIFLGQGQGRTGTSNVFGSYHTAFVPRLSLTYAWNDKTVVRLGYGVFRLYPNYGRVNSGEFWNFGFGLVQSVSTTDEGIHPGFILDQGFPPPPGTLPNFDPAQNNGGTATFVNPSANKPAFMQSWTVDIQRELPFNILLDLGYVASQTAGLWTGLEDVNQVDPRYLSLGNTLDADVYSPEAAAAGITAPYPGFSGSVAQALRRFPQYTTVYDMFQPTGYNTYHSLQIRLQKRYSNGLSLLGAYTLSKNIGVPGSDTFGDIYGGGGDKGLNSFNRRIEKALAPTDRTHVLVLSWTYELPWGRGKKFGSNWIPVVNHVLGGWQINSIERYQSGTPIGIHGGPSLPLFGGGNRPNWVSPDVRTSVSLGDFDPTKDRYLNINAFSQPAPFTFGNAPRLLPNVRVPALYNEDFSVFKRVYFGESRFVEFRTEMFDVFNRVVFGGIRTNFNSPKTFGKIRRQANDPRVIQFALKLIF